LRTLAMGLIAACLVLNLAPLQGTFSFLTSEKKQVSAVSTGTNEDVFLTETKEILLATDVHQHTEVTRVKRANGSTSESRDSSLDVLAGEYFLTFVPQRPHLDLALEQITVTGSAAEEVLVERVEDGENGGDIVFRIAHRYEKAAGKTKGGKIGGKLHVTALGGFYSLTLPLTIDVSYSESREVIVIEEEVPVQPPPGSEPGLPPGTPEQPTAPGRPPEQAELPESPPHPETPDGSREQPNDGLASPEAPPDSQGTSPETGSPDEGRGADNPAPADEPGAETPAEERGSDSSAADSPEASSGREERPEKDAGEEEHDKDSESEDSESEGPSS